MRNRIRLTESQLHNIIRESVKRVLERPLRENFENEMLAYHGTITDFDNFDSSYMGEGEGAQIYGWGHYVTSCPELGQWYTWNTLLSTWQRGVKTPITSYDDSKNQYYPSIEYQVEIPDDNGKNYIWWNEERTEVLLGILNTLNGIIDDDLLSQAMTRVKNGKNFLKGIKTFGSLYKFLTKKMGSAKEVSLSLSEAGFTGIKVYGGSNASIFTKMLNKYKGKKPTIINYVIFKDSDLSVKDKENVEWSAKSKWSWGGKHGFGYQNILRNKNKFVDNNPMFIEHE